MLPIYRRLALDAFTRHCRDRRAELRSQLGRRRPHKRQRQAASANDPHLDSARGSGISPAENPQHEMPAEPPPQPFYSRRHNERIAWADDDDGGFEDLFVERSIPTTPALSDPQAARRSSREVSILVRARPVELTYEPPARPGAVDVLPAGRRSGYVLALARPSRSGRPQRRRCGSSTAHRLPSFSDALRHFVGPYRTSSTPMSTAHRLCRPGWCRSGAMGGGCGIRLDRRIRLGRFIPFEALPSAVNPPSGHFISATTDRAGGYPIS